MARPKEGYRNAAGKRVPGVTTIIGRFKDSSALLWWAFDQGKAAERGEISSLYDKRDQAADMGTIAHDMVEKHLRGEPVPDGAPPEAAQAYKMFLAWEGMTRLEIVEQELPLVSEQHQFGGTLDAVARVNGELALVDWKTSKGVYSDMVIQLAAYRVLWEENFPGRPLSGGFHLCRFDKEHGDFVHHHWQELEDARQQFLLFRQAYEIDKRLKRRV